MMDDEQAVTQTITDYYRAFSTLKLDEITPYFHEPMLLMAPVGVASAADSAALAALLAPTIEGLRARNYGHSEFQLQRFKRLNTTGVAVNGIAVRYQVNGQELERVGLTYLLHKSDGRWRIAVMVVEN